MARLLSRQKHDELILLRRQGKSIPEISRETGIAKTTVLRHVRGVAVPEEFKVRLREKQGGSKDRAKALRENMTEEAESVLGEFSRRDQLLLLIGLYWGEGTKKDFSIINSDPALLQAFIHCLGTLHISRERLALSLRVHREISIPEAKKFWASITGLSTQCIERVEVIDGKKKGKLPYGMCRVRVRSGIRERLLLQSAISLIGKASKEALSFNDAAIVQWIEQGTPKP